MHQPLPGKTPKTVDNFELRQAFSIGLRPLDLTDWIDTDHRLDAELDEKDRLETSRPTVTFHEEPETRASQREVLDALADHLTARFPAVYRRDGTVIHVGASGRSIDLDDAGKPPLWKASRLVQDDLVLMRRHDDGWHIAAASVCFPSSWLLAEKIGKPLQSVHAEVPGFGPGTRTATVIERIFDNLKVDQPVWRSNWSFSADGALAQPQGKSSGGVTNAARERFPDRQSVLGGFLRRERQTLRKMPVSGDILFTIRIYVDPVRDLLDTPRAPSVMAFLTEELARLSEPQIAYKGLTKDRQTLIEVLAPLGKTPDKG